MKFDVRNPDDYENKVINMDDNTFTPQIKPSTTIDDIQFPHPITKEQRDIIEYMSTGKDLVVKAYAGASKTTTLSMASTLLEAQGKKGMYLAFNKSIAVEAQGKMSNSVQCLTTHSLAYRNSDKNLLAKLKYPFVDVNDLVRKWNIQDVRIKSLIAGKEKDPTPKLINAKSFVYKAKEAVTNFCHSSDIELGIKHLPKLLSHHNTEIDEEVYIQAQTMLLGIARKYWEEMIDVNSMFPITHDTYLKLYSLTDCVIPNIDYIMGDEWQDANPCTLEILRKQKCQKIVVGDSHQAIFQFRKSVDALDSYDGVKQLFLTKTFRFGGDIVSKANAIISHCGATLPLIGNGSNSIELRGSKGYVNVADGFGKLPIYNCYIYRTNQTCISKFFELKEQYPDMKVCLNVDISDLIKFANHYFALKEGKKPSTYHQLLMPFQKLVELINYLDETEDMDILRYTGLLDKVGKKIFFVQKQLAKEQDADCIITTCHKVKGLEYDFVYIGDDFDLLNSNGLVTTDISELNLIYVAITRGIKGVCTENVDKFLNVLMRI